MAPTPCWAWGFIILSFRRRTRRRNLGQRWPARSATTSRLETVNCAKFPAFSGLDRTGSRPARAPQPDRADPVVGDMEILAEQIDDVQAGLAMFAQEGQ